MIETTPLLTDISDGPPNGYAFGLKTRDNIRIRVGFWPSGVGSKGTVFLFPGRTGYIERYGKLANRLATRGLSSLVIDWRGHGLSDRLTTDPKVCHINQFSDYQKDVVALVEAAGLIHAPKPWYLIGSSMGACIGLRSVMDGMPVSACAFIAPMWGINLPPMKKKAAWLISAAAQAVGRGNTYAPGCNGNSYVLTTEFGDNTMTNDPEMYEYWRNQAKSNPELTIGGPSNGWLFQSLNECRSLAKMASPAIPSKVFFGHHDVDIDQRAIAKRMAKWSTGKLIAIENAKHDLLSETSDIRNRVLADICDMFDEH